MTKTLFDDNLTMLAGYPTFGQAALLVYRYWRTRDESDAELLNRFLHTTLCYYHECTMITKFILREGI